MRRLKIHNLLKPIYDVEMTGRDIELLEWTLLPEEIDFIRNNARGSENLIRHALQICHLRLAGRFIAAYGTVSLRICNYLTKQLQIDLFCNALAEAHPNTEIRIRKQVSEFLEFKVFNELAYNAVEGWLNSNSNLIVDKNALSVGIEKFLIKEKFILPTHSQLMRTVFNLYSKKQLSIFGTIASCLTMSQKKFIDGMCQNGKQDSENYRLLAEIKKPMGDANVKNISLKIESLNQLKQNSLQVFSFFSV